MSLLTTQEINKCESSVYGGCKGCLKTYNFKWHYTPKLKYVLNYGETEEILDSNINLCSLHYNIITNHYKMNNNKIDNMIVTTGWDYDDALDKLLYPCDGDWYPDAQILNSSL